MNKLLSKVSKVPGVRSSFVFNVKNNLLVRGKNLNLDDETIHTIGVHYIRLMRLSYMVGLDLQTLRFYFGDLLVLGIPLEEDVVLAACCDDRVDLSALLDSVGRDVSYPAVEQTDFASRTAPAGENYAQTGEDNVEEIEYDDETVTMMPDDYEEEDELIRQHYDEIKKALALTIGPLADFVFRDSMDKWRRNGPPIQARLYELITIMAEEIGDLQLADDFVSRLRRFF